MEKQEIPTNLFARLYDAAKTPKDVRTYVKITFWAYFYDGDEQELHGRTSDSRGPDIDIDYYDDYDYDLSDESFRNMQAIVCEQCTQFFVDRMKRNVNRSGYTRFKVTLTKGSTLIEEKYKIRSSKFVWK